jgi:hypothetical protein
VTRVIVLAGLWASLSALQVSVWRDHISVLRQAVRVHPYAARPALNLAIAYRTAGQPLSAVEWLGQAWRLSATGPRAAEIRAVSRREVLWLEAFGIPACSHPLVQPACSSF